MKNIEPPKFEETSPEFEEAFRDGYGGCRRTCDCGRELFDIANSYDWEEGELENLTKLATEKPEEYVALEYSCSTLTVNGRTFVLGCPCNGARPYEDWINRHDRQLAAYLNKRSKLLEEEAKALKVAGVLAET